MVPDRPWQPGETVTVTLNGKGFGSNPRVSLLATDGDTVACLGSEEVTIVGPAAGVARDTQIVFTKSIPSNSPGCRFDLQVVSSGLSGQFFSGGGDAPKTQGTARSGLVNRPRRNRLITFIVHGLSDGPFSFDQLARNLRTQPGWNGSDPVRVVDVAFHFDECASIRRGALELARHVSRFRFEAGDRIAFVAHSMGGLMVRKMLADYLLQNGLPVVGLVTLGTPHLGYPFLKIDASSISGKCAIQVEEMESHLDEGAWILETGTLSVFLRELYQMWNPQQVNYRWLAAAGAFCEDRVRVAPTGPDSAEANGCRRGGDVRSDGVVCRESAMLTYPTPLGGASLEPTERFSDPEHRYKHGEKISQYFVGKVLCPDPLVGEWLSLTNPPISNNPLFIQIVRFLNAL
jgi:pimeloyl-ACP methyl ester carboxylesterase